MDKAGQDWSQFDENGDGTLDSVMILHSGFVAEGGGTDCHNDKPHGMHRIWSHATSVPDNQEAWYSQDKSVCISRYCMTSAMFGTCGPNLQRIGVIGHEMLHTLGLPDMLGAPGMGVGLFDVMGKS
jgi:M6 family metalloprotease-like protein